MRSALRQHSKASGINVVLGSRLEKEKFYACSPVNGCTTLGGVFWGIEYDTLEVNLPEAESPQPKEPFGGVRFWFARE